VLSKGTAVFRVITFIHITRIKGVIYYRSYKCRSYKFITMLCIWMVRGSNAGGGEFPHTRRDRPWGPPSLPYKVYRVPPSGEEAGAWRWPPTPSSTDVKERLELYFYSPSGPSWPILWWNLTYILWYVFRI